MTQHRITVDVAGSTANPGNFVWRCSCGQRSGDIGHRSWNDAEDAGRAHTEDAAAGRR